MHHTYNALLCIIRRAGEQRCIFIHNVSFNIFFHSSTWFVRCKGRMTNGGNIQCSNKTRKYSITAKSYSERSFSFRSMNWARFSNTKVLDHHRNTDFVSRIPNEPAPALHWLLIYEWMSRSNANIKLIENGLEWNI